MAKGFYFSFDAILSLTVMVGALVLLAQTSDIATSDQSAVSKEFRQATLGGQDSLRLSSTTRLNESVNSSLRKDLLTEPGVNFSEEDLNRSVVDSITYLWAQNTSSSRNLSGKIAKHFFREKIPERYGFRIQVNQDGNSTVVYNTSKPDSPRIVSTGSRPVSGHRIGSPSEGFQARVSLSEAVKNETERVFIEGYVGDGNLTFKPELPDLDSVLNVSLEGDFSGQFDLYLNGDYSGTYTPENAGNLSADMFQVCTNKVNSSRCEALDPGTNSVEFRFTGENQSIGGGFINIDYNRTTGLEEEKGFYKTKEKDIPGIDGIINYYGSFYIPGQLLGMNATFHYKADNRTFFVRIGNSTVYENRTVGEETVELSNDTIYSNLSSDGLEFDQLSRETIPLRVGMADLDRIRGRAIADSVSVVDVSGSMNDDPDGDGITLLDEAKNASKTFADIILNASTNRAGFVSYESDVADVQNLTDNYTKIENVVDSQTAGGSTCIGCGIIEAIDVLREPKIDTLLNRKQIWYYNTSYPGSSPPEQNGTSWNEIGYNDSSWDRNRSILGISPDADSVLDETDGSIFFRQTFNYDRENYEGATIGIRSEDAANLYVNGKLVDNDTGEHSGRYWNRITGSLELENSAWFTDGFERGSLGDNWSVPLGAEDDEIDIGNECGSVEGSNGVHIRWGSGTLQSNFSLPDERYLTSVKYSFRQGNDDGPSGNCENPESGEDVYVEYLSEDGFWKQLNVHRAGGSEPSPGDWNSYRFDIPSNDLHENLQIRFRYPTASGSDYDYWAVDNVSIQISEGERISDLNESILRDGKNLVAVKLKNRGKDTQNWATDTDTEWREGTLTNITTSEGELILGAKGDLPSFFDGFEDGSLGANWTCTGGGCGVSSNCAVEGSYAAYHSEDSGSVESANINMTEAANATISYWVRKGDDGCSENPESGEDLYLEYYADDGNWKQVEVFEADSLSDGEQVENRVSLPGDAFHGSFRIRFRQSAGSGSNYDYWHFDVVNITTTRPSEYTSKGTYVSKEFDAGQTANWTGVVNSTEVPENTTIDMGFSDSNNWYDKLKDVPESRYLKYNVSMKTENSSVAPGIDWLNISYKATKTEFDLEVNATQRRKDSMIVMSDGKVNIGLPSIDSPDHSGSNPENPDCDTSDDDPCDDTIEAACRAQENWNVTVYAVGFGSGADNQTLNQTAKCGGGEYYFSSTGELEKVFANISNQILNASFVGQTIETGDDAALGELYTDTKMEFNYSSNLSRDFGQIELDQKSSRFEGSIESPKNGSFRVPKNTRLRSAKVLSYSGNYWTDRVLVENESSGWSGVYNLSVYGSDYRKLGDPSLVNIPVDKASKGENNVSVNTALDYSDPKGGSPQNRVFYTLLVNGSVGFGNLYPTEQKARQDAEKRLREKLDADGDGKIDVKLEESNLVFGSSSTDPQPYVWGPALFRVVVWK